MSGAEGNHSLGGTFGIAFIGGMISMALYGITTLQTYLYYQYYPNDRWTLKVLVASIWTLDTLQVALVTHAIYHYLILNYSNPLALTEGIWSLYVSILCNLLVGTIVQLFFGLRVHILSEKRWWLTILIMVSIAAHFGFGLDTVIEMLILKAFNKIPSITFTAALPFAITAVIPDVLIAASLCYFLHSSRSGFRGTNTLINSLMIYAINRCILTSAMAIVEVVLFAAIPGSFYFIAVDFCIGKLYANSILATLNTRRVLSGRGLESDTLSLSDPSSRSVITPPSDSNPGHYGRRLRDRDVELTDLRVTWPSRVRTQESNLSGIGVNSELHRTINSRKDDDSDVNIVVPIQMDVEAQESDHGDKKLSRTIGFES